MGTGGRREETGATSDLSLDWPQPRRALRPTIGGEDAVIGWVVADDAMRPAATPESADDRPRRRGAPLEAGDADADDAGALRARVADLQAENAELQAENAELRAANADLRAANAALRHRLGERPLVAPRGDRARKVSRRG